MLQSEPSDRQGSSDTVVSQEWDSPFMYLKHQPVIGAVTPRHRRCPSLPSTFLSPFSRHPRVSLSAWPPRFIGQLSEEWLLPRGLLALIWLVDSFSGSGVLFDMSFKSFKELGVSAERLGSFCKRWMARVQRSGCFFPPSQFLSISLISPPSFLPSFSFLSC